MTRNPVFHVEPLARRPGDAVFVVLFLFFAATSFFASSVGALGLELSARGNFWLRGLYWYGSEVAPMFLHEPLSFRIQNAIDTCVFGPFYLVLAYAFTRGGDWIRIPALLYISAISYSMILLFLTEMLGDYPPRHLPLYLLLNLPYLLVPLALGYRVRRHRPFSRWSEPAVAWEAAHE